MLYRQFENGEEESSEEQRKVFFKLKVADSILFYGPRKAETIKNIHFEIEISTHVHEIYNSIKEFERIRFYNLKGYSRNEKSFQYFRHNDAKSINRYLNLQYAKTSTYKILSDVEPFKRSMPDYREFYKNLFSPQFLVTQINLNNPKALAFYQKDIKICKNEIDLLGIVLDSTANGTFGCLSTGNLFRILVDIY